MQLLEETRKEVAGVVDQHVDPAEAVQRSLDRRLRRRGTRDVQLHNEQVVCLADRVGDAFGVTARRNDCATRGERRPRYVDAHPAPGTSDEPNFLVSHRPEGYERLTSPSPSPLPDSPPPPPHPRTPPPLPPSPLSLASVAR